MAKGQMRSTREKKKLKRSKIKPTAIAPSLVSFDAVAGARPGQVKK